MTRTDHIANLAAAVAVTTRTAAEAYALAADIYLGINLGRIYDDITHARTCARAARAASALAYDANIAYAAYITAQTCRAAADEAAQAVAR